VFHFPFSTRQPTSSDDIAVDDLDGAYVVRVVVMYERGHPVSPVTVLPLCYVRKLDDAGIYTWRHDHRLAGIHSQAVYVGLVARYTLYRSVHTTGGIRIILIEF